VNGIGGIEDTMMLVIMESDTSKTILDAITILRIEHISNILPYICTKEQILDIVSYHTTLITPFRIPSEIIDIHEILPCFDIRAITQFFTIRTFKTMIHIRNINNMVSDGILYFHSLKITLWLRSNPCSNFGN
jgi:hypothetical protein